MKHNKEYLGLTKVGKFDNKLPRGFQEQTYGRRDEQVENATRRKLETDRIYSAMSDNVVQC